MVLLNAGDGDVEIWVECEGRRLEEFCVKAVGDKQDCWIASEEGKCFAIHYSFRNPATRSSRLCISLDGVTTNKKALDPGVSGTKRVKGTRVARNLMRPFLFGKLDLQESADILDSSALTELGTIRATLEMVMEREKTHRKSYGDISLPGDRPIDEKSKKAGAHAARLGNAVKASVAQYGSRAKRLPGTPVPAVTYHYAPMDFLRARELVPATTEIGGESSRTRSAKVKREQGIVDSEDIKPKCAKSEKEPPTPAGNSQAARSAEIIDISSGESDYVGDLDPDDQAALSRIKEKLGVLKRQRKVKRESMGPNLTSGDVIVLSD